MELTIRIIGEDLADIDFSERGAGEGRSRLFLGIQKGQEVRKIYLPKGRWLDIMMSTTYVGGQWINLPVNMNIIPIFAKEGAFVPTVSQIKNVSDYKEHGQFLLNYFPAATKSTYDWYEDDGTSKSSIAAGKYTLLHCTGQDLGRTISVQVKPSNRYFVPRRLAINITAGSKPSAVLVNGKKLTLYTASAQVKNESDVFALWMPAINSVQVYTASPIYDGISIVINK